MKTLSLLSSMMVGHLAVPVPEALSKRQDSCISRITEDSLTEMMTVLSEQEEAEGVEAPSCGSDNTITCGAAVPHIQDALTQYGWSSCESIAYYISYLRLESLSLQFNTNQFPGRAGQGTYSMMMPDNLYRFVAANTDNPAIPDETKQLVAENDITEFPVTDPKTETVPPEVEARLNELRDPLLAPEVAFLPAAWYYSESTTISECEGALEKMDNEEGLTDVIGVCTGIAGDEAIAARIELWQRVLNVLGGSEGGDGGDEGDSPADPTPSPEDPAEPAPPAPGNPEDPAEPAPPAPENPDDPAEPEPAPENPETPEGPNNPDDPPAPTDPPTTPPTNPPTNPPTTPPTTPPTNPTEPGACDSTQPTACFQDRSKIYLCNNGTFVATNVPKGTKCLCLGADKDGCLGVPGWA